MLGGPGGPPANPGEPFGPGGPNGPEVDNAAENQPTDAISDGDNDPKNDHSIPVDPKAPEGACFFTKEESNPWYVKLRLVWESKCFTQLLRHS